MNSTMNTTMNTTKNIIKPLNTTTTTTTIKTTKNLIKTTMTTTTTKYNLNPKDIIKTTKDITITTTIPWNYEELNEYFSLWLKNNGHKISDKPDIKNVKCFMDKMLVNVWRWIFVDSFKKHEKRLRMWKNTLPADVYQENCKKFIDYHIYMAWICIRLLLNNGFKPVTSVDVGVMYAKNHKTFIKAFDRKPEQSDAGHDFVRLQLQKIVATANMFQRMWNCWNGLKPHILPSIVIGADTEKIEDCWIDDDSDNNDIDGYVEDDIDYFDDNMKVEIEYPHIEVVDWDTDKVFNFIKNRLYDCDDDEIRLIEPMKYANVKDDPVKGMIYDISKWLVEKEYEMYHVFRISYVVEKLMCCAFRCVNMDDLEYDFKHFPEYMEKCFRTWSDDKESVKKCMNKMYITIAQFQHKWRCLKNKMPLKIDGLTEKDDYREYDDSDDEFYEYKMWLNDSDCDLSWSDVEEQAKKWDEQEKKWEEEKPTAKDLLEQRDGDIDIIDFIIRTHNENTHTFKVPDYKTATKRLTIFKDEI